MADDNVISLSDVDDVSDGETMSTNLKGLEQDIAKLRASHLRYRNRTKRKITQLRESNETYQRDYRRESEQREKDNESWRRKFTDKCDDLKASKREITTQNVRIKDLKMQLKALANQLQRMRHLICDVCFEEPKSQVTRCGHGFCANCLSQVFEFAAEDDLVVIGEASCPSCRRRLHQADDIWPIYMAEAAE